ncbi:MAG: hypothetical protein HY835_07795 [Anaerolineae bacterium]|nr:hypothetical protein [Anaerolineae bacterium]
MPWLLRMLSDNAGSANIQPMRTVVTQADWNYLLSLLRPDSNKALLAAAAVALLLALRRRELRLFVVWAMTLLFFAQPFAPRIGPFRPDLYVILLFIPASIALGALISDATAALSRRTRPWIGRSALALTILLLLLLGWKENRDIINPVTVIATPADLQALQWVRDNTPADARFYINAVAWQGNIYRGMDGGYWIMPFAGRFTSIPPVLYVYMSPDEVAAINRMADQSQKITGCTPDFWQIVSDLNLTHVYVRQATGSLQPAALDECPRLTNIYRDNGIAIYEIQRVR